MSTPLYRDPNASVEERVENLLALMTLDEKLAQLSCLWSTAFVSTGTFDPNTVAEQMPHGIGQVTRIGASRLAPQPAACSPNAWRASSPSSTHRHSAPRATDVVVWNDGTFPSSLNVVEKAFAGHEITKKGWIINPALRLFARA